jgi:beta-glucuronidase
MWRFQFDPSSVGVSEGWQDKLPTPILMPVPAAFADFFTDKASREYTGDFWYETDIYIPEELWDMDISLRFGAAAHRATVYINGVELFSHEGGFLPFDVPIEEIAYFDRANKVTVKMNNELNEACIPVGRTAVLPDGSKVAKGYFDFFNYSGLLRPVKLVAVPKEHIVDFSVKYELLDHSAEVEYTVITTSDHLVTVTVYDEDGTQVAFLEGANGTVSISDVHLWEVHNAYLYRFVLRIVDDDMVIDEYIEDIGIRTFEILDEDFLLNGKPIYLKGFGKHEESDIVGRAYNPGVIKRDFELMKWIGANSFRTAHYPYSEEIYEMADREGFLVIDETPAVGLMASTLNFFDAAGGQQTAFFQKETTPKLLENHLKAVEDLIARDKNHACVIAWCLLNEPESTDEEALSYIEQVFAHALELDPQKRPRTFTSLMTAQPDKCKCYQLCDFISLNRYYGWYVYGGNEIKLAEMAFHHELRQWQEKSLGKPFIFSEYGADTLASEHKLPSVMWGQEYQTEYLQMCHRVFDAYDFVRGEQVWAFSDFQTGEGIMRVDGNKKGIFTRQRQPKAAAYYLKERWESLPIDYKAEGI